MIAIIEVPHRLPATLWWATDDADGMYRADPNGTHDFANLEDAVSYDKNTAFVIRNVADAEALLTYDGHQAFKVQSLAQDALNRGWL